MSIEGFGVYGGNRMCGYGLTCVWRTWGMERLGWVYRVSGRQGGPGTGVEGLGCL